MFNDEWMRENQLLEPDHVTLLHLISQKGTGHPAELVSTNGGALVRQALGLMRLHDVSQLPVMDGSTCVGSVSDWSLSTKSLENPKVLDQTVSDVMDAPFPVVDSAHAVDAIVKLLSKSNPAVLVQEHGRIQGIVTRSDMLSFMMAR